MFAHAMDPVDCSVVMLFAGRENTNHDFEEYLRCLARRGAWAEGREAPVVILVADPGNPPPNAGWRKRIAEATANPRSKNVLFVLVSDSIMLRSVVTAINWLRPPKYIARTTATFDEAVALATAHRGRPSSQLAKLLVEARGSLPR